MVWTLLHVLGLVFFTWPQEYALLPAKHLAGQLPSFERQRGIQEEIWATAEKGSIHTEFRLWTVIRAFKSTVPGVEHGGNLQYSFLGYSELKGFFFPAIAA